MTTVARTVDPSVSNSPIPLDAKNLPTVCVLCSHNCGLRVDVEGGRIKKIRADEENPITHGYLCNKGFRIGHYVEHKQRLEHPLRRRPDGSFERISWDTAISEIAAKLNAIREKHSPRAIGLIGIGGQGNHMDSAYGLTWFKALGSKRWFSAFAQEKHQHFLIDQWMFDAAPSVMFHADLHETKYLLAMGTNPKISNRGHNATDTFKQLAQDPTRTVVVVDPRETETTRDADRHIRLRPGTDVYFLLGMAAVIATEDGLRDIAFIEDRTEGFEDLRGALAAVDVGAMARRCGIEAEVIREVARDFARAESASLMWDLALEQVPFSTLISYLIRVVLVLTGNAGRRGGNIFIEMATPPHRSGRRFAEPERALASGIPSIAALGGFAMFSPTLVPEEVVVDHPERLRALFVEGANPMLSFSDTTRWREARERLVLLVVVDPAMTETAQIADYVLPTPVGYEKWEQAGFPKGYPEIYMQLRPPVVAGPPEALPEPEIYARLAEAMGIVGTPPDKLFERAEHALEPDGAAVYFTELQAASAGNSAAILFWAYRTLGPRLPSPAVTAVWAICHQNAFTRRESVLRTLGAEWEDKAPLEIGTELFRRVLAHPEGVEIARADAEHPLDANLGYEDGRVRLAPAPVVAEIKRAVTTEQESDPEYPFVMAAGLRTPWTANTIQRDPSWRKARGPHCALHLSTGDAERLGISTGDQVRLRTRRGAVELPAAVDSKLLAGHVWVPNGFGMAYPDERGDLVVQGINVNELTDVNDRDPISGCPHHKYTLCQVEPAA